MAVAPIPVSFASQGLNLAGHLRIPESATHSPGPAIVLTGPLSGVKEQVTGLYGSLLADAGFVTLAFDHRNFGASEGEPRQHEDAAGRLADLGAATSYLAARAEVDADRIGACGICLGGGFALRFAAFEPRIRALAGIAGGYNDPAAMRAGMGAEAYRSTLAGLAAVAQAQDTTGEVEYLAAVSDDDTPAVMGGQEPWDYYGTKRSTTDGWVNRLTRLTIRELITTDLAIGADFIAPTPFLVVHGRTDAYCSPDGAASVYERAGQPKDILWLDTTNHIDLYDQPAYVEPAVARTVDWFREHLRAN